MEEKERYVVLSGRQIKDMQNQSQCFMDIEQLCKLLNQQDKHIKELEATNKVLSNELTKNNIIKQDRLETCCGIPIYEIPTLKQSQNQKAVECFEKFKEFCKKEESPSFSETVEGYWFLSARKVFEYIDNQIKSLKGKN